MKKLTCFKAYDIRGKLGEELNEDIAWRIGRAYGEFLKPKTIVLGGDVRLTSETLKLALAKGYRMRALTCWILVCPAPKRSISPRSISAWMAALKLPPAIIRWITTA